MEMAVSVAWIHPIPLRRMMQTKANLAPRCPLIVARLVTKTDYYEEALVALDISADHFKCSGKVTRILDPL
jgi:hypothetical protein